MNQMSSKINMKPQKMQKDFAGPCGGIIFYKLGNYTFHSFYFLLQGNIDYNFVFTSLPSATSMKSVIILFEYFIFGTGFINIA